MTIEINEYIPKELKQIVLPENQKDVLGIIMQDDEIFEGENYKDKAQRVYSVMKFYNSEARKAEQMHDKTKYREAVNQSSAYLIIYAESSKRAINE